MSVDLHIHQLDEIQECARTILREYSSSKCFVFHAEMGSGKTTLISAMLNEIGVSDLQGSPTYSLVNVYECHTYGEVFHLDLYRLKDVREAYDIGIEDILFGEGLIFIEWPEKIEQLLPENAVNVYIRVEEDKTRKITCNP